MTKIPPQRLDEQAHITLALRAAESAERVLAHFEVRHPHDDRPRRAIEAGRAWARGELAMTKARIAAFAAHAAARDARHPAARFAARAAGHAAATAHVAGHARHADAYAAKADAATGEPQSDDEGRTPNQSAAANRRPAGLSDGSGNLSAIVAAARALPAAVAELGR